jgi:hypothetical protein
MLAIGMIGALVYFLRAAESGWDCVLAFPKAIVWPALLVYKLLKDRAALRLGGGPTADQRMRSRS